MAARHTQFAQGLRTAAAGGGKSTQTSYLLHFFTYKILLMLFTLFSLFHSLSGLARTKACRSSATKHLFRAHLTPGTAIQEYYESAFVSPLLMKNCPVT